MAEPRDEPEIVNTTGVSPETGDSSPDTCIADLWVELAWVEQGTGQSLRWSGADAQSFIGRPYQHLLDDQRVSALLRRLDWREHRWSVYGRRRDATEAVQAMDRIELCPPLSVDPMTARNRRVAHRRREAERSRWLPDRRNVAAAGG